jgi:GDP-4-dehydro-6-deoxy-D-mannose reductase
MIVFVALRSILVMGADGFLGRHASAWTHPHGAHVHLTVHHAASVPNLPSYAANEDVQVSVCDLTSDSDVDSLVAGTRPDGVWQCAGVTTERDPSALLRVNVEGILHLCESLHHLARPCRLLIVGSAAEYGASAQSGRMLDETTVLSPVSLYGASKAAGWQIATSYANRSLLSPCAARLFNVVGPGQPSTYMASAVARQIALIERGMQEATLVVGNTKGRRDYIDVRDAIAACARVLECGEPGAVYNVCSGQATLTRDVIDSLVAMADAPITVREGASRSSRLHEIEAIWGDNSRIREQFGWEPRYTLAESLRDLLAWWRKHVAEDNVVS